VKADKTSGCWYCVAAAADEADDMMLLMDEADDMMQMI
jgi:hypothetical protein